MRSCSAQALSGRALLPWPPPQRAAHCTNTRDSDFQPAVPFCPPATRTQQSRAPQHAAVRRQPTPLSPQPTPNPAQPRTWRKHRSTGPAAVLQHSRRGGDPPHRRLPATPLLTPRRPAGLALGCILSPPHPKLKTNPEPAAISTPDPAAARALLHGRARASGAASPARPCPRPSRQLGGLPAGFPFAPPPLPWPRPNFIRQRCQSSATLQTADCNC